MTHAHVLLLALKFDTLIASMSPEILQYYMHVVLEMYLISSMLP